MSDAVVTALLGAIAGVLGGIIAGVFAFKTQKPISDANAASAIQKAAVDLIKPYQDSNADLVKRVNELEAELTQVRAGFDGLLQQNAALQTQITNMRIENEGLNRVILNQQVEIDKLKKRGGGFYR